MQETYEKKQSIIIILVVAIAECGLGPVNWIYKAVHREFPDFQMLQFRLLYRGISMLYYDKFLSFLMHSPCAAGTTIRTWSTPIK